MLVYIEAKPIVFNNKIATDTFKKLIREAKNNNNSDIYFVEFNRKLMINYCWENQEGLDFLAEAYYEGTLEEFLKGWFPEKLK